MHTLFNLIERTLLTAINTSYRMQIFSYSDAFSKLLLFSYEKFLHAFRVNRCFRYHKYYPTLPKDIKNFAIFLL